MRNVFALIFRGDLAQLDQLLGLRIKRRRINKRRADPERARFHFLADELAHLLKLLRSRLLVLEADDVLANRGRPDKRSDITRDARCSRYRKYSASVAHLISYLMSPWSRRIRSLMRSLSGPIENPSPMIWVVTPWRISLCERPSSMSDSVDQESMLMKPGATAIPLASTIILGGRFEIADANNAFAANGHIGRGPGPSAPSVTGPPFIRTSNVGGDRRATTLDENADSKMTRPHRVCAACTNCQTTRVVDAK